MSPPFLILALLALPNFHVLAQQYLETCHPESMEDNLCSHTSLLQTALAVKPYAQATPQQRHSPAQGNVSSAGKRLAAELDRYILAQMESGRIPGVSAVVLHNDKILWDGQYGSSQPCIENGPKVKNDTVFGFASMSKTIVGVSVMILYEKGLIDPQADINTYLPFKVRNPNFPDDPITIHGLITHTSSLTDHHYHALPPSEIYVDGGDPIIGMETFFKDMLSENGRWRHSDTFLYDKPQTAYSYCNIAAALAGYIVEIITQRQNIAASYDDFVRSHVLAPLQITNAGYLLEGFGGVDKLAPPVSALPSVYSHKKKKFECQNHTGYPDYPDGMFKASPLDYARLFGALMNNGSFQGVQLLKPQTVAYMRQQTAAPCHPLPCGLQECWSIEGCKQHQSNAILLYFEQPGRTMLGMIGLDEGIINEGFFNVHSGIGYVLMTNGNEDNSKKFSDAFDAIAGKLMATFDGSEFQETPKHLMAKMQ